MGGEFLPTSVSVGQDGGEKSLGVAFKVTYRLEVCGNVKPPREAWCTLTVASSTEIVSTDVLSRFGCPEAPGAAISDWLSIAANDLELVSRSPYEQTVCFTKPINRLPATEHHCAAWTHL